MREIKFKCWDVERKAWLNEVDTYAQVADQARFNPENRDHFILCQYTGERDAHGSEIWEGDVVKLIEPARFEADVSKISEVRFVNGGFTVEASGWFNMGESDITTVGWAIEEDITIEVIGNKFENPELLTP